MSLGLNRNGTGISRRNRQDDVLPPYSPPSPRTKAAMVDLPPAYEETNNTISTPPPPPLTTMNIPATTIIVSTNTLNSNTNYVNIPTTYVINPNINAIPDIVIDPVHTHNTTEE